MKLFFVHEQKSTRKISFFPLILSSQLNLGHILIILTIIFMSFLSHLATTHYQQPSYKTNGPTNSKPVPPNMAALDSMFTSQLSTMSTSTNGINSQNKTSGLLYFYHSLYTWVPIIHGWRG